MKKNFPFFVNEDRSQDLIFDYCMHFPLFKLVILPSISHLLIFVILYVLTFLFRPRQLNFYFVIIVSVLSVS